MFLHRDIDFRVNPVYVLTKEDFNDDEYFQLIAQFVNMCEEIIPDRKELLISLKILHSRALREPVSKIELLIQESIAPQLEKYASIINAQLAQLPFIRAWNGNVRKVLRSCHLIMLEIELMNRINRDAFLRSHGKIAILPGCIHSSGIKPVKYFSAGNYGKSFVNNVSGIFLDFGIDAYLWMSSSVKSIFSLLKSNREHFGVIGIGCISELYSHMQKCMKLGIPVLGVPLNMNPCSFSGESIKFHSIYLKEVEKLLAS
jgi:hypothetical protein